MYFHIGQGEILDSEDVIGIFDLDITSQSYITREYLKTSEKNGEIINKAEDIPKSYIVCANEDIQRVYLSQPAPATLAKRSAAGLN